MHVGLSIVHKLTLVSSPPVATTRLYLCPIVRHVTLEPCATNSAFKQNKNININSLFIKYNHFNYII
jgi:hypothetical protein